MISDKPRMTIHKCTKAPKLITLYAGFSKIVRHNCTYNLRMDIIPLKHVLVHKFRQQILDQRFFDNLFCEYPITVTVVAVPMHTPHFKYLWFDLGRGLNLRSSLFWNYFVERTTKIKNLEGGFWPVDAFDNKKLARYNLCQPCWDIEYCRIVLVTPSSFLYSQRIDRNIRINHNPLFI